MKDKKTEKRLAELMVMKKGLCVHRDSVEKFMVKFEEERDQCQIPVRLESLDRSYHEFLTVQEEIELLDDPEMLETHLTERSDFESRYCTAKGFLLSKRSEDANRTVLNASHAGNLPAAPSFHLRLPKIDLPKFSGDFSKWLSFRDTYMSMVHSNADIPTVAKLQYLLQSLEGEAHKPFESVDVVADNYATVWDALLKRYDNRRFLKKQLYRSLHDLPVLMKESAHELHELVDEFQRHVKALAKLGEPTEHWDTPLLNMLSYKLDSATIRAWEERASQKEEDAVKYDDLIEFLYQRVRILKSVSSDVPSSQSVQSKVAGNSLVPKKIFPSKIAANAAASESTPYVLSCFACSENHYLFQCPTFADMSVSSRRELVSQRKLCWNCFRTGHHARNCGSKFTCRICQDRHHTLLHDFSSPGQTSSSTPAATAFQEPPPNPPTFAHVDFQEASASPKSHQVSMAVQSYSSTVLLETVALNVIDDHGKVFQARALLDSASMSNFMSNKLAKLLSNHQAKMDVTVAGIGQSVKKMNRSVTTTIKSRVGSYTTKLEFLIIDKPSVDLPTVPAEIRGKKIPNVHLADPQYSIPSEIDIVIGGEAYWALHTGRKFHLGPGLPHMIETKFGWTFSGPTCGNSSGPKACLLSTTHKLLDATRQWRREINANPMQSTHSAIEKTFKKLHNKSILQESQARYVVRQPETDDPEIFLGNSRSTAERRQTRSADAAYLQVAKQFINPETSVEAENPRHQWVSKAVRPPDRTNRHYQQLQPSTCSVVPWKAILKTSSNSVGRPVRGLSSCPTPIVINEKLPSETSRAVQY